MITPILYGIGLIVFLNLLGLAYIAGWELAGRTYKRASVRKTEPPLRCECRRYGFPSPICHLHGGLV